MFAFREQYRPLLFFYNRSPDYPILLRFSNSLFNCSIDRWRANIESVFGTPLALWSEEIGSEEELDDVMITLSKSGSVRTSDPTHFIYGFFSKYPTHNGSLKLVFDMIFNGEVDFFFSGNPAESNTLVRRVFEKSPEYTSKLIHLQPKTDI
jgi:hypothetical protein